MGIAFVKKNTIILLSRKRSRLDFYVVRGGGWWFESGGFLEFDFGGVGEGVEEGEEKLEGRN